MPVRQSLGTALRGLGRIGWVGGIVAIFAVATWFRVSSLGTAPETNADEAFFGVQTERILLGQKPATETNTHKFADPLYIVAGIPGHLLWGRSPAVDRIPAAAFGLAAIALTFFLGRRWLETRTAALAAGLLAVLPISILNNRICYEYADMPLLTLLLVLAAARGHYLALLAIYPFCVLIGPTTLFLAPVPMALLLWRWLSDREPGGPWRRHLPLATALALGAYTLYIGIFCRDEATARWTYETYGFGPPNWPEFLRRWQRHLLAIISADPVKTLEPAGWAFWIAVGLFVAVGFFRLIQARRWDRVALVGGWLASVVAYHQIIGPGGFHPWLFRYGVFLLTPTVVAVACLADTFVVRPGGRFRFALRAVQATGVLAFGAALLAYMWVHWFQEFERQQHTRSESIWTLRTEAVDVKLILQRIIERDLADGAGGAGTPGAIVLAENWWAQEPLVYYFVERPEVRVVNLDLAQPPHRRKILRERMETGAYAVGEIGGEWEKLLFEIVPRERLRVWYAQEGASACHALYRVKRPGEVEVGVNARGSILR